MSTPITAWEKLEWLTKNAYAISMSTNDHARGRIGGQEKHPTVEEWNEIEQYDFEDDAVKAECIRLQHVVHVQCYPRNSVGFYSSDHYDLEKAIEEIFEVCHREIILERKYGR